MQSHGSHSPYSHHNACAPAATTTTTSSSSAHPSPFYHLIAKNPYLAQKLEEMRLPLSPLVHICSGRPHPEFPRTILHYWLLTESQLESLAHFYHQRTPGPYSSQYPCPISWDTRWSLEEKRRHMGRFIGLPACFAPLPLPVPVLLPEPAHLALKTEEQLWEDIRREAMREEEEELYRGKLGRQ